MKNKKFEADFSFLAPHVEAICREYNLSIRMVENTTGLGKTAFLLLKKGAMSNWPRWHASWWR